MKVNLFCSWAISLLNWFDWIIDYIIACPCQSFKKKTFFKPKLKFSFYFLCNFERKTIIWFLFIGSYRWWPIVRLLYVRWRRLWNAVSFRWTQHQPRHMNEHIIWFHFIISAGHKLHPFNILNGQKNKEISWIWSMDSSLRGKSILWMKDPSSKDARIHSHN